MRTHTAFRLLSSPACCQVIFMLGYISAHLNPATCLALWVIGKASRRRARRLPWGGATLRTGACCGRTWLAAMPPCTASFSTPDKQRATHQTQSTADPLHPLFGAGGRRVCGRLPGAPRLPAAVAATAACCWVVYTAFRSSCCWAPAGQLLPLLSSLSPALRAAAAACRRLLAQGAALVFLHYLPHFQTLPEPPAASPDDLLLRRWGVGGRSRGLLGPLAGGTRTGSAHAPRVKRWLTGTYASQLLLRSRCVRPHHPCPLCPRSRDALTPEALNIASYDTRQAARLQRGGPGGVRAGLGQALRDIK